MAPSRGNRSALKQKPQATKKPASSDRGSAAPQPKSKPAHPSSDSVKPTHDIPLSLYQRILDAFTLAFPHLLSPAATTEELSTTLQEVKGHLYDRDFDKAFSRPENLEAYAVRWSSSRALGYVQIFAQLFEHLEPELTQPGHDITRDISSLELEDDSSSLQSKDIRICCLGGGAGAEIAAIAATHFFLCRETIDAPTKHINNKTSLTATIVDIADWSGVTQSLEHTLTHPPPLSIYASAAAKAANAPLIPPSNLTTTFRRADIIAPSLNPEVEAAISTSALVTLMFTLNELYATSTARTQAFLLDMTSVAQQGTLLAVVDSAGSYASVPLNGGEKTYPMRWLLEHTLLKIAPGVIRRSKESPEDAVGAAASKEGGTASAHEPVWEQVYSTDSRWFRFPEGLRYPLDLENMRFQMHLYRRL